ncbi:MAG: hypothetical protein H7321_00430 [Bacteroidia bacterium]|nr:hypothetical protein [Bacteroidia bacterium]
MEDRIIKLETEVAELKNIIMGIVKNQQDIVIHMTDLVGKCTENFNIINQNVDNRNKGKAKNIRQMLKGL